VGFSEYYYTLGVTTYELEIEAVECTQDLFDENPDEFVQNFQTYDVHFCQDSFDYYQVNVSNLDTFFAIFDVEVTNNGNDIIIV
jgi:hypothetical protein